MSAEAPLLPRHARLPINRCNFPAAILGGLTFQKHPAALILDGVAFSKHQLFAVLDGMADPQARAQRFVDFMVVSFRLKHPEDMGFVPCEGRCMGKEPRARARADYLRTLRGWAFDADGREAAVLKAWVESRFGLLTRYHGGVLADPDNARLFDEARSAGLYGTSALEAQLDLLFAFAQYELQRRHPEHRHLVLYRGVNRLDAYERMDGAGPVVLLLNNLNSFSGSRERACEFGDTVLEVKVPLSKIFFFAGLLPGRLAGEDEYAVLGGLYEVSVVKA